MIDPARVVRRNVQKLAQLAVYDATEWPEEQPVEAPVKPVRESCDTCNVQVQVAKRFQKDKGNG